MGVSSITQLPSSTANSSVVGDAACSAGSCGLGDGLIEERGELGIDIDPGQETFATGDEIDRRLWSADRFCQRLHQDSIRWGHLVVCIGHSAPPLSMSIRCRVSNARHDPRRAVSDTWKPVTVILPISSPDGSRRRRWSRHR